MSTYTVHAPPPRQGESTADPARFKFVRDGFYVWAFLLAPVWLLLHRLWLAFVGYLVLGIAVAVGLHVLRVSQSVGWLVGLLIALLIGFEASTLWRWTLARRGWTTLGFTVGDDLETAERRFFAAWSQHSAERKPAAAPAMAEAAYSAPPGRGGGSGVIGLFPEPGGSR